MIYKFDASKADRQVFSGTIEALSEKMAEEALYRAGYKYVLDLKPKNAPQSLAKLIPTFFGVKTADIIDFSRQLAAFLDSGSSLRLGLELLRDQSDKAAMKEMISQIIENLEQGIAFSQAVKNLSSIFPFSYWQIVQSSEKAGDLARGLKQIADYMEQRSQINNRIRGALTYPAFVVVLAIGVVILLVTTVLPPILKLFKSFNTELPPLTRFAMSSLQFLTDYKIQLLLAVVILVAGIWAFSRIPQGRVILDGLILKIPVLGTIIIQNNLGHFCRTASMLMTAGLPLPSIMDISIKVVSRNQVILKSLTNLRTRLMQGEGLAVPISQDKLFPRMMARMIAVGEQTGTLDASLATLAAYYEDRANKKTQSLISLIEPVMTVAIGLGIAFIMISMIMPIYGILNKVH